MIHEVYEHENAQELFENELDIALDAGIKTIIIEPSKLGDETSGWITIGNCLHKTSVLSGLGCLISGSVWPDKGIVYLPLGFISIVCASVYGVSWQFDPCCKYQVEHSLRKLQRLPVHSLTSTTPVVLVRKDDKRRKILHNTVSLAASAFCVWKLYKTYIE